MAKTQLKGESLQEFATVMKQLAHWARQAAHALHLEGGSICTCRQYKRLRGEATAAHER